MVGKLLHCGGRGVTLDTEHELNLGPAALFFITIVVTIAIALAYVGGVMSGRSSAEHEYQEMVAKRNSNQEAPKAIEQNEAEIKALAPEELEFSRVLRNEQRMAMRGQGQMKTAVVTPAENKPTQDKPTQEKQSKPTPKNTKGLYDYVYQVAAVKSDDEADALRQRLEGRGLRTSLKRQGKLLLILIKLRGDANMKTEVVQLMGQMRLGRPILVSQKPVE